VVAPVHDLPIELPPGRRESYPAEEAVMDSLVAQHEAREACDRLLRALARLAPED
jgi:hypothetical protein